MTPRNCRPPSTVQNTGHRPAVSIHRHRPPSTVQNTGHTPYLCYTNSIITIIISIHRHQHRHTQRLTPQYLSILYVTLQNCGPPSTVQNTGHRPAVSIYRHQYRDQLHSIYPLSIRHCKTAIHHQLYKTQARRQYTQQLEISTTNDSLMQKSPIKSHTDATNVLHSYTTSVPCDHIPSTNNENVNNTTKNFHLSC